MSTKTEETVCNDQKTFNKAVILATNNMIEKRRKVPLWALILSFIIVLVIIMWSLVLAAQNNEQKDNIIHYVLALVFAPVYIMAHYIDAIQRNS